MHEQTGLQIASQRVSESASQPVAEVYRKIRFEYPVASRQSPHHYRLFQPMVMIENSEVKAIQNQIGYIALLRSTLTGHLVSRLTQPFTTNWHSEVAFWLSHSISAIIATGVLLVSERGTGYGDSPAARVKTRGFPSCTHDMERANTDFAHTDDQKKSCAPLKAGTQ